MDDKLLSKWEYPYFRMPNSVIDRHELDSYELAALVVLMRYADNHKSSAWPSFKTIAKLTGTSRNRAIKSIDSLIEKKYLIKKNRSDDKGNSLSNLYYLVDPSACDAPPLVSDMHHPSVPDAPPLVHEVHPKKTYIDKDLFKKNTVEIINYFNQKVGTNYKPDSKKTQSYIHQRLAEGFSVDDFKTVINKKCRQWMNDPNQVRYLRPSTLFSPGHFEEYLNEVVKKGNGPDDHGPDNPAYKKNAWDQYK
jgi:uncharacterized phage protein (TIGR02220 family)